MTDKLKCPFCGAELVGHEDAYGNISDIWFDCPNEECEHVWTTFRFDIWQALIDGKKAQGALKIATDFIGFVNTSRHSDGDLAAMAICKLNEITSITKGQDNE